MPSPDRSYDLYGPAEPQSPIILSVPHAGRDYPLALRAALNVPLSMVLPLEDRYVDALAIDARGNETLFVATRPRAWIDLNRSERERDPQIDEGAIASALPQPSAKLRSGLGLIPRRAGSQAGLWNRKFSDAEVRQRIEQDHRPYHIALATALEQARDRFGIAILLDIHSMPGLPDDGAPEIVLGDRFGRAASARLISRAEAAARASGFRTAINAPYAGGHILERHADPARNIHGIQIEIDRNRYLDARGDLPGPGATAVRELLVRMIDALADEAAPSLQAAE